MKILKRLRELNPESFTEYYQFLIDFIEYTQLLAGANMPMDELLPQLEETIQGATVADLEKINKLFEAIDFTNYHNYRSMLEFSKINLLAIFQLVSKEAVNVEKSKRRHAICISAAHPIYVNLIAEIKQHSKISLSGNGAVLLELKNQQAKLNAAIAKIGNHGLHLKQHHAVEPAKAKILIELAIQLRVAVDVYYESSESNNWSYADFLNELMSKAVTTLETVNESSTVLHQHRNKITNILNQFLLFLKQLFYYQTPKDKPGFFTVIKTKSVQSISSFIQYQRDSLLRLSK